MLKINFKLNDRGNSPCPNTQWKFMLSAHSFFGRSQRPSGRYVLEGSPKLPGIRTKRWPDQKSSGSFCCAHAANQRRDKYQRRNTTRSVARCGTRSLTVQFSPAQNERGNGGIQNFDFLMSARALVARRTRTPGRIKPLQVEVLDLVHHLRQLQLV